MNSRKLLSYIKWTLIDKLFVSPIVLLFRMIPITIAVRVKNKTSTFRKLDFEEEINMLVGSTFEQSRLKSCKKEPDTICWIKQNITDNSIFFDIGANVGAYSLVASKMGQRVKVFSFEPSFSTYKTLVTNIIENSLETSIVPLPIALSQRTSLVDINFSSTESGAAEHAVGNIKNMYGENFQPVSSIKTLTYSLDDFLTHFSVPVPNFVKIDVDGNELEILKGAKLVLKNEKLRSLLVEVKETSDFEREITKMLATFGFCETSRGYATTEGFANIVFDRVKV